MSEHDTYAGPEQWDRLPIDAVKLLKSQALSDVHAAEAQYAETRRPPRLKKLNAAKDYHSALKRYLDERLKRPTAYQRETPRPDVMAAAFLARHDPRDIMAMSADGVAAIVREAYEAAHVIADCSEDI